MAGLDQFSQELDSLKVLNGHTAEVAAKALGKLLELELPNPSEGYELQFQEACKGAYLYGVAMAKLRLRLN